jgi:hypothetical protein
MQQEQLPSDLRPYPSGGLPSALGGSRQGSFLPIWQRLKNSADVCLVGGVMAGVLLLTSSGIPMVWDEGNAIWRSEGISAWVRKLLATPPSGWAEIFSRDCIRFYWRYTVTFEGHPAFYGMVMAAGRAVAPSAFPPWHQARVGPVLLFALALAAVYWRVRALRGRFTGLATVAGICFIPQVLAHAQFATPDSPLCSLWLLTWASFPVGKTPSHSGNLVTASRQVASIGPRVGEGLWEMVSGYSYFGLLMGLTLATKFTGWLSPVPYIVYVAVCERTFFRVRGLLYALGIALLIFVAVNPPLWHEPIAGMLEFWKRNLDRSAYNVSIFFLGKRYDLYHPLPWYNTLVWIGVGVPTFVLICAVYGAGTVLLRLRQEPWAFLLLMHALILLVVRATPYAPPHDGLRLFLPSVAFFGILAGLGMGEIVSSIQKTLFCLREQMNRISLILRGILAPVFLVGGTVVCLRNLVCYYPHWLSFYNAVIGGPRGAWRAGLEPTYYWDALTPQVIDWLGAHSRKNEKVYFAAGPYENLLLLDRWGLLPFEFRTEAPGQYRWYVHQYRFGVWEPEDWWLAQHKEPAYTKWLFESKITCGKKDIPLLSIYPMEAYWEAREAVNQHHRSAPSTLEGHRWRSGKNGGP